MTLRLPDSARSPRYSLRACLEQNRRPPTEQCIPSRTSSRRSSPTSAPVETQCFTTKDGKVERRTRGASLSDRESAIIVPVSAVARPPSLRCCRPTAESLLRSRATLGRRCSEKTETPSQAHHRQAPQASCGVARVRTAAVKVTHAWQIRTKQPLGMIVFRASCSDFSALVWSKGRR